MMRNEDLVAAALAGFKSQQQTSAVASKDAAVSAASGKPKTRQGKRGGAGDKKKSSNVLQPHKFPVEPRVIQVVNRPKSYMNHSYRDFSQVPPEMNHVETTNIDEMTFPQKVHHILSQEADYGRLIAWHEHGRSFRVIVPIGLEKRVLEKYFGHKRYSSFLRQLNNYGFKHVTKGPDRNSYYHEFMLRGMPHLCKYMPEARDARRLIPDPGNEPDFYKISAVYPLGGSAASAAEDDGKMPAAPTPVTSTDAPNEAKKALPPPQVVAALPAPVAPTPATRPGKMQRRVLPTHPVSAPPPPPPSQQQPIATPTAAALLAAGRAAPQTAASLSATAAYAAQARQMALQQLQQPKPALISAARARVVGIASPFAPQQQALMSPAAAGLLPTPAPRQGMEYWNNLQRLLALQQQQSRLAVAGTLQPPQQR